MEWYRQHAVTLAKKLARHRDNDTCRKCGRKGSDGWQIHGSHILSEGAHKTLSADPANIDAMCATCHAPGYNGSWHDDPAMSIEWFDNKFPGRRAELIKKDRELLGKQNWKLVYLKLKDLMKFL